MSTFIYEDPDAPRTTFVPFSAGTPDTEPGQVFTDEYTCVHCGTSLTYAGKGRKPTQCTVKNGGNPECFSQRGVSTSSVGSSVRATKRVEAALAVMDGVYDSMLQVLMVFSPRAAMELENRIPKQQLRNRTYFEANPKLCERVCSWGGKGGTLAFLFSNALLFASVGRVAYGDAMAMRQVLGNLQGSSDGTTTANGEPDLSQLFANLGFSGQA